MARTNALFGGNKAQGQEQAAMQNKTRKYPISLGHGHQFMTLQWRIAGDSGNRKRHDEHPSATQEAT